MFYEEKEINEIIKCPYCKNKYNDPRFLPCSLSMCYDCIELLSSHETRTIECVCSGIHQIPSNGFLKNTVVAKLAETKPNQVYRGEKVEQLQHSLSQIKQKLNDFKSEIEMGKDKIIEHCNSVKNEIQLKTETILENIRLHSIETIKEVDDYQNECLLNYEKKVAKSSDCYESLMKANQFYLKWNGYLSNCSLSEDQISIAQEHTHTLIGELEKDYDEFKCKLFGNNLIKFEESQKELDPIVLSRIMTCRKHGTW